MLHAEGAYSYRGAANHRAAWLRHARMSIWARLLRCTECGARNADFVVTEGKR